MLSDRKTKTHTQGHGQQHHKPDPITIKEVILFLVFLVLVAFSPCWCFRSITPTSRSEKAGCFLGIMVAFGVVILWFIEPFHYVSNIPVFNLHGEKLSASGENQDALDSLTNGEWVDSTNTSLRDTDTHNSHQFVQMPMPLWREVHRISHGDSERRIQFWLSHMFLSFAITMIFGSGLLYGAHHLHGSRDFVLVDSEHSWVLGRVQRGTLCGLAAFAHLTVVTKIMLTSVWSDRLSIYAGPDWEGYAEVLDYGLLWMVLQVLALVYARPGARFAVTAFAEAALATLMPFVADPFDSLKDCLFAAFALDDPFWVSQAIGWVSLAWLWCIHIFMMWDGELRLKLEGSYLSVLSINPVISEAGGTQNQPEDLSTAQRGCCSSLHEKTADKVLRLMFKQTTPERRRAFAIQDSPQGVMAVCFSLVQYFKHGVVKPVVVVLNIVVPLFRYFFAWYLCNMLQNSETVKQWLDDQFIEAVHGGDLGKADFFVKHRKGIFGLGTVDAANRYLEMVGINQAEVTLKFNDMAESFKVLASSIQAHSTWNKFDIGENEIGGAAAAALVGEALKVNSTWQKLNLEFNSIDDSGTKALGEGLQANTTLKNLFLSDNSIGDSGAKALGQALKANLQSFELKGDEFEANWNGHILDLSNKHLGDDGTKLLAEGLQVNSTLQTLRLAENSIGDLGAEAFGKALKANSTLQTLGLRDNMIEDPGAAALGAALKGNTTLKTCWLHGNKISAATRQKLQAEHPGRIDFS
mmetsp:Transcript_114539/g.364050  ORF Transcript_114539/g.364050 Transcript_114539/m.364050 type:complete len:750 (+) Transcript_114539:621-2870(+)